MKTQMFEDMLDGSGDEYESNCTPNFIEEGVIKFDGVDPCQVHLKIMDLVYARSKSTFSSQAEEFKIIIGILVAAAIEASLQLTLVILSCTQKKSMDSLYE